jgi:hypothetical protein
MDAAMNDVRLPFDPRPRKRAYLGEDFGDIEWGAFAVIEDIEGSPNEVIARFHKDDRTAGPFVLPRHHFAGEGFGETEEDPYQGCAICVLAGVLGGLIILGFVAFGIGKLIF